MNVTQNQNIDNENFIGDRQAEQAVLAAIFSSAENATRLLAELTPDHFCWSDCRYMFTELQLMHRAGLKLDDAAAIERWFLGDAPRERLRAAGIEHAQNGQQLAVFLTGVPAAELPLHIAELNRWRQARAVRRLAWELGRRMDETPAEPATVLAWAAGQLDSIAKLA
jgi:replicative DNA helicase